MFVGFLSFVSPKPLYRKFKISKAAYFTIAGKLHVSPAKRLRIEPVGYRKFLAPSSLSGKLSIYSVTLSVNWVSSDRKRITLTNNTTAEKALLHMISWLKLNVRLSSLEDRII